MKREVELNNIENISVSDSVRVVTSEGASRKTSLSALAKGILETYAGTSLAGTVQSVKDAIDGLRTVPLTMGSFNSLPQTINNAKITEDHVVVKSELSNPGAQTGDWTVTTSAGSLTITGSISGSTTLKLYLQKS